MKRYAIIMALLSICMAQTLLLLYRNAEVMRCDLDLRASMRASECCVNAMDTCIKTLNLHPTLRARATLDASTDITCTSDGDTDHTCIVQ